MVNTVFQCFSDTIQMPRLWNDLTIWHLHEVKKLFNGSWCPSGREPTSRVVLVPRFGRINIYLSNAWAILFCPIWPTRPLMQGFSSCFHYTRTVFLSHLSPQNLSRKCSQDLYHGETTAFRKKSLIRLDGNNIIIMIWLI